MLRTQIIAIANEKLDEKKKKKDIVLADSLRI